MRADGRSSQLKCRRVTRIHMAFRAMNALASIRARGKWPVREKWFFHFQFRFRPSESETTVL